MAQKIFPRSLRNQKLLSNNFSFYSDLFYANEWKKSYILLYNLYYFSLKNLVSKKKRKLGRRKGSRKRILSSFIINRFFVSNQNPMIKISPILMKFANQSFSKKYHPIRTVSRFRRSFLKKNSLKNIKF